MLKTRGRALEGHENRNTLKRPTEVDKAIPREIELGLVNWEER